MSLGLTKTKRRIASVQSTKKITKAMEMVSTVKLKRYRDGFENDSPYLNKLAELLALLLQQDGEEGTHYGKENEEVEGSLYLVVTSNLGLCAAYNNNLFKFVKEHLDPNIDTILPIGQKAIAHYSREGYPLIHEPLPGLDLGLNTRLINEACLTLKQAFNDRKFRKISIIYTKYVNSLSFVPTEYVLLPIRATRVPKPEEAWCPPLYDESARVLIHQLLPQYLGAEIYGKLLESQLSEQASRRTAMENANDNADELLEKLTIEYNKARQTAITQEIVEVVSGSANS